MQYSHKFLRLIIRTHMCKNVTLAMYPDSQRKKNDQRGQKVKLLRVDPQKMIHLLNHEWS